MNRTQKAQVIDELYQQLTTNNNFYIADSSTLTVAEINKIRENCFKSGLTMRVAKNTLIKKALERIEEKNFDEVYPILKGPSTIIFSETANAPARLIKDYRAENKKSEKPTLKAACIDGDVFIGDDQLEALSSLKSKNELIADVVALLQSPAKNVISALQSGGSKLAGILKTLAEREEA
jgi:large subunit ribosomal protein L10